MSLLLAGWGEVRSLPISAIDQGFVGSSTDLSGFVEKKRRWGENSPGSWEREDLLPHQTPALSGHRIARGISGRGH